MTRSALPASSPFIPPAGYRRATATARRRSIPWAPAEGWLGLGLLIVMGLTVGSSIDDARWVLGRDGLTDFLPWAIVMGIVFGFIGAKAGWSRKVTYTLGAVFAALIIPTIVGASLVTDHVSIHDWYVASANAAIQAYLDLALRGKALTQQYGHFLLVLGLLGWGTGLFAGYVTFALRRPGNAVLLLGILLVVNMSITIREQLQFLVMFTLAALLFLIRVNTLTEHSSWIRRRIGDPKAVAGLYFRGGVAFVMIAVLGSLFLTASASSAPLAGAWSGIDQGLINIGQQLQRYLPGGGPGTRITGVAFGSTASISGRWVTDSTPALSITVPVGDKHIYYWQAVAYDQFDLTGWSLSSSTTQPRADGEPLMTAGGDEATPTSSLVRKVTFTIHQLAYRGSTLFSPSTPATVNRSTRVTLVGGGQLLGTIDLEGDVAPYTVTAVVPRTLADDPKGLTENKLRAAGGDYPAEIRRLDLEIPSGTVGPDLQALLETTRKLSPSNLPYDIASRTAAYLRSDVFTYNTDVTGFDCGERSVVECFAHFKQGYCQHYASTMVILMRMQGIPARLVQGFLPGDRDPATGTELIRYSNSHAWVQIYFPGQGWVDFDPTGGGIAQLAPLPVGPAIEPAAPSARGSFSNVQEEKDPALPGGLPPVVSDVNGNDFAANAGSFIFIAVLLFVVVGAAVIVARRRSRSGAIQPDAAYGSVARLASRLGFGPRPTETVYEYANALADVLPMVRPELQLVAQAKVEVTYGRQDLGADRLAMLRDAQRRIRVRLLRLIFRRRRGR
jgi:transglutaminase-like putative cysteine protease